MGLGKGHAFQRQFASGLPKWNGGFSQACSGKVMSQHFGFGSLDVREALLDYTRDLVVQGLSTALEQRVVGGVLNQRMLKRVRGLGRGASTECQPRFSQLVECAIECLLCHWRNRCNQLIVERPADSRADLRNLLHRHEAI